MSDRAGINAKQMALAKMGGSKRERPTKRATYKRERPTKRATYKHKTHQRRANRRMRKTRGGAVAPTTAGGSQDGSNKLFMAQQQAEANRQFDTPNKT
jgi:hypothetical protein